MRIAAFLLSLTVALTAAVALYTLNTIAPVRLLHFETEMLG